VGFQVSLLKTISLCVGVGRDEDESVVIALAPIAPGGRGRSDGRRVKYVYLKVWAHGPRSSQIMHHDRIPCGTRMIDCKRTRGWGGDGGRVLASPPWCRYARVPGSRVNWPKPLF
jgi:hypothetical protein